MTHEQMQVKVSRMFAAGSVAVLCAALAFAMTGDFNITGNLDVDGNTALATMTADTGTITTLTATTLTASTTLTMPDSTVTTSKIATNAITTAKILGLQGVNTMKVVCIAPSIPGLGVCTSAIGSDGECTCTPS